MKIFVTGSAGFIGHRVVQMLQDTGHDVYSCDSYVIYEHTFDPNTFQNLYTPFPSLVKASAERIFHERIFNFKNIPIKCNICDRSTLMGILEDIRPEIFIHLAAMPCSALVKRYPDEGLQGLSSGLFNAISSAVNVECETFVYVSDASVYGTYTQNPQTVYAPCAPGNIYSAYKLAGETMVKELLAGHTSFVILRPTSVYGPYNMNNSIVEIFLNQASKNETLPVHGADKIMDFIYVDDCARGIVQAALSKTAWYGTYNIGTKTPKTLLDVALLAKDITSRGYLSINNGDISNKGRLDISSSQKDFGFNPTVSLETGMKETWEWMRQQKK